MSNKKFYTYIGVGLFTLFVCFTGISFAYFQIEKTQTQSNTMSLGCFNMGFIEQTASVSLINTYPISDPMGATTNPYTFTITNTCDLRGEFKVTLDIIDSTTTIDLSKVKISLNGATTISPTILGTLPTYLEAQLTAGVRTSYILVDDGINAGEGAKQYSLRIWVDESAGNSEMAKNLNGRITVTSLAKKNVSSP